MTLPRHPDKHGERSVLTPEASIDYFYDDPPPVPKNVILCYHDGLVEYVTEAYDTTPFEAFGQGYAIDETDGTVGVLQVPGVGAPTAVLSMEGLIARGAGAFVSVGHVGSLQPDVNLDDLIVVDRALRDEGTSYHYLEPDAYVDADEEVRARLGTALDDIDERYRMGSTWTTDAPHRETAGEVERYRGEGILTVDMEAAAVFAVAKHRGVAAGALFTISDVLDPDGWEPRFTETREHLERALDATIEALRFG